MAGRSRGFAFVLGVGRTVLLHQVQQGVDAALALRRAKDKRQARLCVVGCRRNRREQVLR